MAKIITWNCYVYDSAKGIYDMILDRYILPELGLNLKLSDHVIEADDGILKGSMSPMVDMRTYEFNIFNSRKISPKELFTNAYTE